MITKRHRLEHIAAGIVADNICPDLAGTANNLVFGEGDPDADVMFVGEAPGKQEDLSGRPFVGAAGRFLDEMLDSIGLKREDVYITSIIKYRPPYNRDPRADEKEAFWPYLQAQLEVIQPKLIVTLGRHSANCFLPDLHISKAHGQLQKAQILPQTAGGQRADGVQGVGEERTEAYGEYVGGVPQPATQQSAAKRGRVSGSARKQDALALTILPLYHPAAALYNGAMRQTLMDDFAEIPIIIGKLKKQDLNQKRKEFNQV